MAITLDGYYYHPKIQKAHFHFLWCKPALLHEHSNSGVKNGSGNKQFCKKSHQKISAHSSDI